MLPTAGIQSLFAALINDFMESLSPLIKVLTENISHQYFFIDNILVIVVTNSEGLSASRAI